MPHNSLNPSALSFSESYPRNTQLLSSVPVLADLVVGTVCTRMFDVLACDTCVEAEPFDVTESNIQHWPPCTSASV